MPGHSWEGSARTAHPGAKTRGKGVRPAALRPIGSGRARHLIDAPTRFGDLEAPQMTSRGLRFQVLMTHAVAPDPALGRASRAWTAYLPTGTPRGASPALTLGSPRPGRGALAWVRPVRLSARRRISGETIDWQTADSASTHRFPSGQGAPERSGEVTHGTWVLDGGSPIGQHELAATGTAPDQDFGRTFSTHHHSRMWKRGPYR